MTAPLTLLLTYFTVGTSQLVFEVQEGFLNDSASHSANFILSHDIEIPKRMPDTMNSPTSVCAS